jgi:hypothetical protein
MVPSDEVGYDEESTDAWSTEVDAEDSEWVPNEDEDKVEDTESGMDDECEEEDDDMTETEEEEEDDEQDNDWDILDAKDEQDYEADVEDYEQDDDWHGDAAEEDDDDYQVENVDDEDEDDDYYEDQDEDLPLKKRRCVHKDGVHEMVAVMHKEPPCDNQGCNGKEIIDKSGSSDEGSHEESFDTNDTEDP